MKILKFRWHDESGYHYREVIMPDNAQRLLYVDKFGREVYENEIVFDGDSQYCTEVDYPDDENAICLDYVELDRMVYKDIADETYIEHEPLLLTEATS